TSDVGKEWWFAGGGATEKDGGAPRRKRRIAPVENRSTASLYKKVEHRETSGACRHSPRRLRKTTAGTAALSAITAPPAANTIKAVAPTAADRAFADSKYKFSIRREPRGANNNAATSRSAKPNAAANAAVAASEGYSGGTTSLHARPNGDNGTS